MSYPPLHPASPDPIPMVASYEQFAAFYPDESGYVEWKESFSQPKVQAAVAAFSNAEGGVLLLGVADDGRIVGRPLSENLAQDLHRAIGELHDPGRYEFRELLVGEKQVTAVSVARREHGFAQLPDGRVLVRRGKMNLALFGDELRTFVSGRSLVQFDRTAVGLRLSEASPIRLALLRQAFLWPDDVAERERLREQGLIASSSDADPQLTVAGAAFLLDAPDEVLGKSYIEVFRFPEGGAEYDRRIQISGAFSEQIEHAAEVITDAVGLDFVVLGTFRHELVRLPEVVVREALANAVAHRDLELHGVSVRVDLYPDYVRILSPGSLPEPVTTENIRDAQSARNPSILNVLRRFRLAEDAGRGIDVMQDTMRAELLELPEITEFEHAVEVVLRTRGTISPEERAWVREVERRGEISPPERIVLVHAARGDVLTNSSVRDLLGMDSVDARQLLQRLRDVGFLEQAGARGGTTYRVSGDLRPPAGLRLEREELEELVLAIALSEGRVTNAIVRNRTGLDRVAAGEILGRLAQSGGLIKHGTRRGTYYTVPDRESELDLR